LGIVVNVLCSKSSGYIVPTEVVFYITDYECDRGIFNDEFGALNADKRFLFVNLEL
jgi:hypothetical protein